MQGKLRLHEQIRREMDKPVAQEEVNRVRHGKIIFYIQDGKLLRGEGRNSWQVEENNEDPAMGGFR